MSIRGSARAFAPASVGNVGVGFDILGHALDAVGDVVVASRSDMPGVSVTDITGVVTDLPTIVERNTAGRAVQSMWDDMQPGFGVTLAIEKGIPLGSGMGGSAASAVAAVVAANALLPEPVDLDGLFPYALIGEAVASGSVHADNVAASLFGGLVYAYAAGDGNVRNARVPVPAGLQCVLVHPHCEIKTRDARLALNADVALPIAVEHSANLAGVILACHSGDLELLRRSLRDVLVEPQRAHLVPGFAKVKQAALAAGALGCSLSGSGPSLFAWAETTVARDIATAMSRVFASDKMACDVWVSAIDAPGARLTEQVE
jgi:homoserine kinase